MEPNMNYFRVFSLLCNIHIPKITKINLTQKQRSVFFVGYDPFRKGRKCMDPKPKKFNTYRDVEVSSYYQAIIRIKCRQLECDKGNLQLSPKLNADSSSDKELETSNTLESKDGGEEVQRRSTKEKKQPQYHNDYGVYSCFYIEAVDDEEPTRF